MRLSTSTDRTKATVNLDGLHKLSSFHRKAVLKSKRIGCFFCMRFHKPSEITEWIDHREKPDAYLYVRRGKVRFRNVGGAHPKEGQTALCPHCGIDAVIPDRTFGFRVTRVLLVAMCERWFTASPSKP